MKRQRRGLLPSFDPPCRCAGSSFFTAERHFRRGSRPAAAGGRRRQDAISAAAPLCAPEPFGRGPQTAFAARWIGSRRTCFPRGGGGRRRGEKTSSVSRSLDSFPVRGEAMNPAGAAVPVSPRGTGRRGRRPLQGQPVWSLFQGRRLPPLREMIFRGRKLSTQHNGGEI